MLSNKFRKSIFDELASGKNDINSIAKKHRIINKVVERVADDFINGDILEKKKGNIILQNREKN